MKLIDLCCGEHPKQGFEGLDVRKKGNVKYVVDLNKGKLPFKNNSVDEFYEQNSFYELENPMQVIKECYRCLKVGGVLEFKEMHFSSPFAYLPYTKNFWAFSSARLFTPKYVRDYGWNWGIVSIDFDTGFEHSHPGISKVFKFVVNINKNFYEKHLSRIAPIFRVVYKLRKIN